MDERFVYTTSVMGLYIIFLPSHNYTNENDKSQHNYNVAKKRQLQSTIAPKKKSKVVMDEMDTIVRNLEELCRRSSTDSDEDELFGKTIAATFRRFDSQESYGKITHSNCLWI